MTPSAGWAQWLLPVALGAAVVYQVFIRKDEGRRGFGVRVPDPKASAMSKKFAKQRS
jgi:hypothetical protein